MDLVVVILVVIALWLMYSLVQSYRSLANKIQDMSDKCMLQGSSDKNTRSNDPVDNVSNSLMAGLGYIKNYASK
jgi:hypothetical protein